MIAIAHGNLRRLLRASRRWLALGVLAFGLAGCGVGLLYPRLDSVVGFYIEGLVSLDPAQSAMLKRTLSGNLAWHKDSELRRYAAFLEDVAASVGEGAGRDDWSRAFARTEEYWRDIFEQAAPGYTALAATLTDAQVEELLENLEDEDEEAWRDHSRRTPAQRQARREKSIRRAVERFTGPLDAEQRALIRDHVAASPSFMPEWRENRRVWRAALAGVLENRTEGARFEERMFVLIARPDELWTGPYRAALEGRRTELVELMARLDGTLTPKQRSTAHGKLLALAQEIEQLAGRPG